jgi:putative ABC transport system ATP-binding protein
MKLETQPRNDAPRIQVRNVTKTYDSGAAAARALDGVSLDVRAGEVVMLMGPSGSGKTTLISIMGCILRATSGSVRLNGQEITQLREKQLPQVRLQHIGFVFQGFNLFPALTAAENVEVALDLKGFNHREKKRGARALLEQVGLGDKLRAFPADLSGGQKQRIAIARALAGEPEIILADEPTAALDSGTGRVVMELLHSLAKSKGRSIVVVTHDNRVLEYGDRVVRIEDGRILNGEPA